MAPRLLKPKSMKARAAEERVRASSGGIVVAGTYRGKQLAWIEKNGVYNWPVKEGDEFTPESFGKIGELWLYADAKATRHVFAAEFVGKATQAEFVAAHPTYAKQVGKPKHAAYYVFKATRVDYPPELGNQTVVARAVDFATGRGQTKKIAAAVERFKKDGEFAPLACYLPKELGKVPRPQLRVCEAAVQFADFAWSPIAGLSPIQEKIDSIVMSVASFGRQRGMSSAEAYCYLNNYAGMTFLDEHYSTSRCYSEEMIDESLSQVCRNHGGALK